MMIVECQVVIIKVTALSLRSEMRTTIAKQIPLARRFKSYSQFLNDARKDRNVVIFSLVYY